MKWDRVRLQPSSLSASEIEAGFNSNHYFYLVNFKPGYNIVRSCFDKAYT